MPRACLRLRGGQGLRGALLGSRIERTPAPLATHRPCLRRLPSERSGRFHVEHRSGEPSRAPWLAGLRPALYGGALRESRSGKASHRAPRPSARRRCPSIGRESADTGHQNPRCAARVEACRRRSHDLAFTRCAARTRTPCRLMQPAASCSVRPRATRDAEVESGPFTADQSPRGPVAGKRCRRGGVSDVGTSRPGRPREERAFHVERQVCGHPAGLPSAIATSAWCSWTPAEGYALSNPGRLR
jgi:hypothetical protein